MTDDARIHQGRYRVSVLTPCYNEAGNVEQLYSRVRMVFDSLTDYSHEHIFIDNASTDDTVAILRSVAAKDPRVKVIKLRRNYGQTAALAAGITVAGGRILVTMDGDQQNDDNDFEHARTFTSGVVVAC